MCRWARPLVDFEHATVEPHTYRRRTIVKRTYPLHRLNYIVVCTIHRLACLSGNVIRRRACYGRRIAPRHIERHVLYSSGESRDRLTLDKADTQLPLYVVLYRAVEPVEPLTQKRTAEGTLGDDLRCEGRRRHYAIESERAHFPSELPGLPLCLRDCDRLKPGDRCVVRFAEAFLKHRVERRNEVAQLLCAHRRKTATADTT